MTVTTGSDPAQAAAAFRASVEDHHRQALTRAVEALEDMPASQQLLEQAQRVRGSLDAAHHWTGARGLFEATSALAWEIRLFGGYDSKQSLYSRVASVRSAAMGKLGRTTGGAAVARQPEASVTDRVIGAVFYGDASPQGSAGLGAAVSEGAQEGAQEGLRNLQDAARPVLPWLAIGAGAVVALVVVVKVLR